MDRRTHPRADTFRGGCGRGHHRVSVGGRGRACNPFVKAGNRRNYFFVGLLVLLSAAAGPVHLPDWAPLVCLRSLASVALDVVLFILAVMGGRVLPMSTNNGVPGTTASRHPQSSGRRWASCSRCLPPTRLHSEASQRCR